jgi:hypothetical protein
VSVHQDIVLQIYALLAVKAHRREDHTMIIAIVLPDMSVVQDIVKVMNVHLVVALLKLMDLI